MKGKSLKVILKMEWKIGKKMQIKMITADNLETFSNIRIHLKDFCIQIFYCLFYLYAMLFLDEAVYRL